MPIIPTFRRLKQKDQEVKANPNYIPRPYLKKVGGKLEVWLKWERACLASSNP
jgi:hypothetical protein